MELKIYANQKKIKKVLKCSVYDIMLGTLEDILAIVDSVASIPNLSDDEAMIELVNLLNSNLPKIKELLKDIFIDVTDEDLRHIKVKELVPLIIELVDYTKNSLGGNAPKN